MKLSKSLVFLFSGSFGDLYYQNRLGNSLTSHNRERSDISIRDEPEQLTPEEELLEKIFNYNNQYRSQFENFERTRAWKPTMKMGNRDLRRTMKTNFRKYLRN
ncbi:Oidioi.mRNA.OKI2018_I69.chr1.g1862.t1.cds [Oikopleura dioica]|uniref:Oidioi.mRNA.OKI2018_I69.chr1.g1862.t1.cds n=1 Tax=Oikopleura dioica TaxID=34765 RepID=A0ABN7SP95_OIKDI|nr:Oidioi.mRNA.OKI2018_I69.chr1.g1862.t1.cds [Oikopleura dioica]